MKVIIVSGYFDPLHVGHIECMQLAKRIGDKLVILLNSDKQCELKKGKAFMFNEEKKRILQELRCVDEVFDSIDKDRSVCESIKAIAEKYSDDEIIFAKGGDRFVEEIPETKLCREIGVEVVDGLGEKIQSSSNLTGLKEIKNG
ncbi:MAG: adenylyltransferase/cytidyltransferase family protein [archaeon]